MPLPRRSFASKPRKPLKTTKPMKQISDGRREKLIAAGIFDPFSTFAATRTAMKASRPSATGPKRPVLEVVNERAGELCEFPICIHRWTDTHHRLNRKSGGRHGEMAERINGAEWLLKACREHHAWVTSPVGDRRESAMRMGWLLLEREEALHIPVLTRHDEQPIWLLPDGTWLRYEEACA